MGGEGQVGRSVATMSSLAGMGSGPFFFLPHHNCNTILFGAGGVMRYIYIFQLKRQIDYANKVFIMGPNRRWVKKPLG